MLRCEPICQTARNCCHVALPGDVPYRAEAVSAPFLFGRQVTEGAMGTTVTVMATPTASTHCLSPVVRRAATSHGIQSPVPPHSPLLTPAVHPGNGKLSVFRLCRICVRSFLFYGCCFSHYVLADTVIRLSCCNRDDMCR